MANICYDIGAQVILKKYADCGFKLKNKRLKCKISTHPYVLCGVVTWKIFIVWINIYRALLNMILSRSVGGNDWSHWWNRQVNETGEYSLCHLDSFQSDFMLCHSSQDLQYLNILKWTHFVSLSLSHTDTHKHCSGKWGLVTDTERWE